ncbi:putative DNA modification/repair radical SAM protein [Oscillospiraceae bacterium HV4-5-C5C]|nr:putative DNA modification/repair radical SAM protein [Oscillospiraceae bacterium HV4-5-C5C]
MDVVEKLGILAAAAKYDVSCSSSGSTRARPAGGLGQAFSAGICHSWTADGRCVSLLKVLFTNQCIYDCAYCLNRRSNDIPRAAFEPEELTALVMGLYRRNFIEGLFLSSAVAVSPDRTMEQLWQVLRLLRERERFGGYIHVKLIPGADPRWITIIGHLADRLSLNAELPTESGLKRLAPAKSQAITLPAIRQIGRLSQQQDDRGEQRFLPAGQSTQLIVGATADNDRTILLHSQSLYRVPRMKRVYYSAYVPLNQDPRLPVRVEGGLRREHRLYQCDWLLRFYRFSADELLPAQYPDLLPELDPKTVWALRHPDFFPIEVNRADYWQLLRVPGIGPTGAQRITAARRGGSLRAEDLPRLKIVMKRARYFITCGGRSPLDRSELAGMNRPDRLAQRLAAEEPCVIDRQQDFFSLYPELRQPQSGPGGVGAGERTANRGAARLPDPRQRQQEAERLRDLFA